MLEGMPNLAGITILLPASFPFLPEWFYGLSDHLTFLNVFILLNGWICLHGVLD